MWRGGGWYPAPRGNTRGRRWTAVEKRHATSSSREVDGDKLPSQFFGGDGDRGYDDPVVHREGRRTINPLVCLTQQCTHRVTPVKDAGLVGADRSTETGGGEGEAGGYGSVVEGEEGGEEEEVVKEDFWWGRVWTVGCGWWWWWWRRRRRIRSRTCCRSEEDGVGVDGKRLAFSTGGPSSSSLIGLLKL